MSKRFAPFGTSAVDALVKKFFERKGLNPDDVIGYQLNRSADDLGTITIKMHFDDEPAQAEVTGIDQAESQFIRRYPGELGPELLSPEDARDLSAAAAQFKKEE